MSELSTSNLNNVNGISQPSSSQRREQDSSKAVDMDNNEGSLGQTNGEVTNPKHNSIVDRQLSKDSVRVTRSDPLTTTNRRSHLIRGSSNVSSSGSKNVSNPQRRVSTSSRERRARWIKEKLQNYYGSPSYNNQNAVSPPVDQYLTKYNKEYPQYRSLMDPQPRNKFSFDWDANNAENSVTSVNWISGNDSKSSKFHQPYSLREQDRFREEAASQRNMQRSRLRTGLSLPDQHQQGRISYYDSVQEDSGSKYLETQTGDTYDQVEQNEEEEEDDEYTEDLEGKPEFHLTRQRNRPYPYRLKRHYSRFGEEGGRVLRNRGTTPGKEEGGRSRSQSPCSISSESESQDTCENALDPPRLTLPNGEGNGGVGSNGHGPGNGRKFSVLFSFNDAWNEENIVQSFKELNAVATSLFEATWTGNLEKLEEILADDENLKKLKEGTFKDNEGRTLLHLASACGHVSCVELLLHKGADVNATDGNEHRATPLSCAASCGSQDVVKVLLKNGADVNSGYDLGKTALHWAVQAGSVECAKIILEAGAKQNPPQVYSETPLHIASALGDAECVQLLLDHGADVNLCKGSNRSTALHLAAEEGSAACVRLLLKGGASHAAKDIRGHTALHVAATCDADSVIALLKAGADPNSVDANGRTALHCAVARGSRAAECVRLLVENGADIDAQDNYGYTALHLAGVNESSLCASILLHHGSDVTLKTNAGTNALSLLVRKIPDVMRFLVERLDSAVTIHDHDPVDPDCEIRLDFRAIVPNCEKKDYKNVYKKNSPTQNGYSNQTRPSVDFEGGDFEKKNNKKEIFHKPHKETEFLTCLVAAGNKKILSHPLSEAFLTLKWRRVRKFFWASLLFQIALVALFTIYVVEVYLIRCPYHNNSHLEEEVEPSPEPRINESFVIMSPSAPSPPVNIFTLDKLLKNTSNLAPAPNITLRNPSSHNVSRRSADPEPGFQWFSFNVNPPTPKVKNQTRTRSQSGASTRTIRHPDIIPTPVSVPTQRTRGRVNDVFIVPTQSQPAPAQPAYSAIPPTDGPDKDDLRMEPIHCILTTPLYIIWILLVTFTSLMAIKEIFQLIQSPLSYVVSSENWGQWLLISSVSITAWSTPDFHLEYWQYPAAACGIFLAWGLMLLQVGRFPALGVYVQMLGKVAANFGLFILAYACLLIAFALAFCVLFPEHPPYSSVPPSILKVFTMMVGEVDYEDLFYKNEQRRNDPMLFPITAHLLYGAFVVIVTIVLMNLLVGLAVHDIQGLQKGAKLNRLSRQTALISRLESFIFSKKLQILLPNSLGSILQKSALLVPSSYNWSFYFRPNDLRDKRLPKDIKLSSLRLAASRHSSSKSKSHHRSSKSHQYHQLQPPFLSEFRPVTSTPRPMSTVSHHTRISNHHHQSETAIRRIEQRLDHLQLQLDRILTCMNGKMDAVFEAILSEDRSDFRRLSSMLERSQSLSDNENIFLEGPESASTSPGITSDGGRRPMFSTEPSILKDVSCEKG